ncbi:MAG: Fe(3+) ABC transporter substrate-binding protein [Thiohalomonadaceae bacterium]
MKFFRPCLSSLAALFVFVAASASALAAGEVNLYSARQEVLIRPLLDRFSAETGVKVNLVSAKADALLQRLKSEGRNSPADVLLTVDAGNLHAAKAAGVLQPISSQVLEEIIPAFLRDPDGHWFSLSLRARTIMYVKDKVSPDELSSYEALADEKWRGRICIRSSEHVYNQSLLASMIATLGEQATEEWARKFVDNFARKPQGGDRDQIKAAAAGMCDIAIANTYYLAQMMTSQKSYEKEAAAKLAVFWPNQADRGTHVNVSGVGITAAAPHRENALRLLEFLLGEEAQHWYADANQEYPVRKGVSLSAVLQSFGEFRADELNLARLGENNAAAVRLLDRVGWR